MNAEQKAAYINAMVMCAAIEAQAMGAANTDAALAGQPRPYHERDFRDLIERHGIHHNAVITFFTEV